jgi:hypothetical protein
MKHLNELIFLLELWKREIFSGRSSLFFVKNVLNREFVSLFFRNRLQKLLQNPHEDHNFSSLNLLDEEFFQLLQRSLLGEPVSDELEKLLDQVYLSLELEYDRRLGQLPIYLSFFLLFFIFPAYMLLLMGPILEQVSL